MKTVKTKKTKSVLSSIAEAAKLVLEGDNYVGALQNACVEKDVAMPKYLFGREIAPAHKPVFTCRCTIQKESAHGNGPSKQEAKRNAAKAWVENFRE